MNQKIFERELERRIEEGDYYTAHQRATIIKNSVMRVDPEVKLGIVMEELAECAVAVSKVKRFVYDEDAADREKCNSAASNLIEEMADVYICMSMVSAILGICPDTLYAAIDTKLAREAKRRE